MHKQCKQSHIQTITNKTRYTYKLCKLIFMYIEYMRNTKTESAFETQIIYNTQEIQENTKYKAKAISSKNDDNKNMKYKHTPKYTKNNKTYKP